MAGLARQRTRSGLARLVCLTGLTRPLLLTTLLRRARRLLQALPARRARLLQSRLLSPTIWRSRLLQPGPLSRQAVLALRTTGLAGQIVLPELAGLAHRAVRIHKARIGAAEGALLVEHAAAKGLHRVHLPHKAGVARDHLRRDRDRHGGKAHAA